MSNSDIEIARRFHDDTKYWMQPVDEGQADIYMGPPEHERPGIGEQDLAIEPHPYKVYLGLDPIPLPPIDVALGITALNAISETGAISGVSGAVDLEAIARLCLRSSGLLKPWTSPSGKTFEFRAAGCTGARYHIDLYLVTADVPGLAAGVYHYAPDDHALRLLRAGDFRQTIVDASGQEPAIAAAPVIAALTSTFWRNAWRYQERTYRHVYWDAATVAGNLLAVSHAVGIPVRPVIGFVDDTVNNLLGVDGDKEAAVLLFAVGAGAEAPREDPIVEPINVPFQPPSAREIDFPGIREMHRASSLTTPAVVAVWRQSGTVAAELDDVATLIPLQPEVHADDSPTIEEVINRRRSNRHYAAEQPLPFAALSTALDRALTETRLDCLTSSDRSFFTPYLIVNNVEGLQPGAYVVHKQQRAIELLAEGDARERAVWLGCDQEYAGTAQVNIYALADLDAALERFGNRGYRVAQFESALFGAKVQLAAHALGLGAVGLTSVDDEVIEFFSPHAAGRAFMFVALLGIRRRPERSEQAKSTGFLKTAPPDAPAQ